MLKTLKLLHALVLLTLLVPASLFAAAAVDLPVYKMTELASPSSDDAMYIIDNPGGTPLDRKISVGNLFNYLTNLNLSNIGSSTSAHLAGIITNETGTNLLVFNTSPTLITPNLGTPSAAVLTNATGLPIATGVSGLGAGVAAFLGSAIADGINATHIDETANYIFTGTVFTSTTVAALGTPTLGVFKTVNDASGDCTTDGGTDVLLCRGNGESWDRIGGSSGGSASTDTFSAVATRGDSYYGAVSSATSIKIGSSADSHIRIYDDPTIGLRIDCYISGVLNDCDYIRSLNATKNWGANDSTGTRIFEVREGTGTTRLVSGTQAQGDILYFNGTIWARLAPGTSGHCLKTGGAGANPAWAAC